MKFKGKYKQKYSLDKEQKELVVRVELKPVVGQLKPRQNTFYGVATVNEKDYDHPDLEHCVNAQFMADDIGLELIAEMRKRYSEEGKIFRLKKK